MVQRLFFLLLLLTPTIVHGQITQYETVTVISAGIQATYLVPSDPSDFLLGTILFRSTYFRSKKRLTGSKRLRYTTIAGIDISAINASGIHIATGTSQISRYHQITVSAGIRLAMVPSLFVQFDILAFPLKQIGIIGINFRVHGKMIRKEVDGYGGFGVTLGSYRRLKP